MLEEAESGSFALLLSAISCCVLLQLGTLLLFINVTPLVLEGINSETDALTAAATAAADSIAAAAATAAAAAAACARCCAFRSRGSVITDTTQAGFTVAPVDTVEKVVLLAFVATGSRISRFKDGTVTGSFFVDDVVHCG